MVLEGYLLESSCAAPPTLLSRRLQHEMGARMKVVVVGATGLIGSRVMRGLAARGISTRGVARELGVNAYTGEGLAEAMADAEIVVDVSNSTYADEAGAREYFEGSSLNLLSLGRAVGVRHHIVLSIVGVERLSGAEGGYFRAKWEQERLVQASGLPYTIVHATQFFEFIRSIADYASHGDGVRVAHALVQPMAADDVAAAVVDAVMSPPAGDLVEHAGPDVAPLEDFVRIRLRAGLDEREVDADPLARFLGMRFTERMLLPGPTARIADTRFGDWMAQRRGRPGRWPDEKGPLGPESTTPAQSVEEGASS